MPHNKIEKIIGLGGKKLSSLKYYSLGLFFLFTQQALAQTSQGTPSTMANYIPIGYKEVDPLHNTIFQPAKQASDPDTVTLGLGLNADFQKTPKSAQYIENESTNELGIHNIEQDSNNYIYVISNTLVRGSYKGFPFHSGKITHIHSSDSYKVSEITIKESFAPGQKDSIQFLIIQTAKKTIFTGRIINRRGNLAVIKERIGSRSQEQKLSFFQDSIYYTGSSLIASLEQTQIIDINTMEKAKQMEMDLHFFNSLGGVKNCIKNTEDFRNKTLDSSIHTVFFVGSKSDYNGAFRCEENLGERYASGIYINLSSHSIDSVLQHINENYPDRIFNFIITTHGIDQSNYTGKITKPSTNESQTLFSTLNGSKPLQPKEVLKTGAGLVFIMACQGGRGGSSNHNSVNSLVHTFHPKHIGGLRYAGDPILRLTDMGLQILVTPVNDSGSHSDTRALGSGFYLLEKGYE